MPLIVKQAAGGGAGRRVVELVQYVDVVPTILDLVKAPVPGKCAGPFVEGAARRDRPIDGAFRSIRNHSMAVITSGWAAADHDHRWPGHLAWPNAPREERTTWRRIRASATTWLMNRLTRKTVGTLRARLERLTGRYSDSSPRKCGA